VYHEARRQYLGFLDIKDVVALLFHDLTDADLLGNNDVAKFTDKQTALRNTKCIEAIGMSRRNPFFPVEGTASLQVAIDALVRWKVHRIPVVDENGNLITILTQSHVVSFLEHQLAKHYPSSIAGQTVEQLKLGYRHVISIHYQQKTSLAFKLIFNRRVSAIAVVDDNGKLVGTISASDLSKIEHDGRMIALLGLPVCDFCKLKNENEMIPGPISISPRNTIEEVLYKIDVTRVHRVWVLDDEKKHVMGVISLIDLLDLFCL
jgi:CBS-domain-containing membrane protein